MKLPIKHLLLLATAFIFSAFGAVAQQIPASSYTQNVVDKMVSFYDSGIDEKLYLQLDKPYYSSGDKIWFKGYLRNAITHAPLEISNYIYVELVDRRDELVSRVKVKRDSTGFNGYMILDAEMDAGEYTLRGYTRWMRNNDADYFFSRAVNIISSIPETARVEEELTGRERRREEARLAEEKLQEAERAKEALKFDLQFFPEGGCLLAGALQSVAFKAVGADGLSVDVAGNIYNSDDDPLCEIKSTHKGMGMVNLSVAAGERYYVKATSSKGTEQRFDFPAVETEGAVINAVISYKKLIYQTRCSNAELLVGAHVIVHSRGRLVSVEAAVPSQASVVNVDKLSDGINTISLVNAAGHIISERLVFKVPKQLPTLDIATDGENYGRREKAVVNIKVLDINGAAAAGEFGVSVTDDSSVKFDTGADNILSNLLLTSDLKGYIEEPGLYFTDNGSLSHSRLDLLMRTQGWRRFDLEKVLGGEIKKPEFLYEDIVEISGDVKGFFGNDARKPTIHVMSIKMGVYDSFELGKNNDFVVSGLDIPDSMDYVVQARGRRGGGALKLNVKPETFPEPKSTLFPSTTGDGYVPISFVNQSQDKFFYDGGMNLINIDAVYVTVAEDNTDDYVVPPTRSTNRAELDESPGMSLAILLQRFPGIVISDEGEVSYKGSSQPARFIYNGVSVTYEDISYLTAFDLERIHFFDSFSAIFYHDSAGGIFVIDSRKSAGTEEAKRLPSVVNLPNLGYQKPTDFYQPAYEVASIKADQTPDFRTTIFWSGELEPDAEGNIQFEFYTADKPTSYTINVEGVTDSGEICKASKSIHRSLDR